MTGSSWPQLKAFLATPAPPELGPGPRDGVEPEARLVSRLNDVLERAGLPSRQAALCRALVLLWHDHLDSAHCIAQEIEDHDGAFVHGIVHRREPDFGNARYWFRRVGTHPAFPQIAERVRSLPAIGSTRFGAPLATDGQWDAFAFIDACQHDGRGGAAGLLREIQRIETEVLLEQFSSQ